MNIKKIAYEGLERLKKEDKLDRIDIPKDILPKGRQEIGNIKSTRINIGNILRNIKSTRINIGNILRNIKLIYQGEKGGMNKVGQGIKILNIEYMKEKLPVRITQMIPIDKPIGRKIIGIIEDGEKKGKEITIIRDTEEEKGYIL